MTHNKDFQFNNEGIQEWQGYYKRIYGETPVFSVVKRDKAFTIVTNIKSEDLVIPCEAISSKQVEAMIDAINQVKRKYNGKPGGSFMINEFGQVIVPTIFGKRFYVGSTGTEGVLLFKNLDTNEIIDLSDDSALKLGDNWDKPYVGTVYHLSGRSELYSWNRDSSEKGLPAVQDKELINKIRKLRRSGSVKLLVNPYGIILTKVPIGEFSYGEEQEWQAVYVGRVNFNKWFLEEDVRECQKTS